MGHLAQAEPPQRETIMKLLPGHGFNLLTVFSKESYFFLKVSEKQGFRGECLLFSNIGSTNKNTSFPDKLQIRWWRASPAQTPAQ